MKSPEGFESQQWFERAWKRWLDSPTHKSPEEAAAAVAQLIRQRRRRARSLWLYAAAAALLIAGIMISLSRQPDGAVPERSDRKVQEEEPLGQGQILLWLDGQTPLYMTY